VDLTAVANGSNVDIAFTENAAWRTSIESITATSIFPGEIPVTFDNSTAGNITISDYGTFPFPLTFTIKSTNFEDQTVTFPGVGFPTE